MRWEIIDAVYIDEYFDIAKVMHYVLTIFQNNTPESPRGTGRRRGRGRGRGRRRDSSNARSNSTATTKEKPDTTSSTEVQVSIWHPYNIVNVQVIKPIMYWQKTWKLQNTNYFSNDMYPEPHTVKKKYVNLCSMLEAWKLSFMCKGFLEHIAGERKQLSRVFYILCYFI